MGENENKQDEQGGQAKAPRGMTVFVIFLVGVLLAGLVAWISGYGNKKLRGEVKADPTATAIYELERRIGLVAGEAKKLGERTSALESRTTDLEKAADAARDRDAALTKAVGELANQVNGKADKADMAKKASKKDLDKYALNGRVDMLEADVVAIKAAPPVTAVAQTQPTTAGTVTVRVRTVPVEPDEQ